MPKTESQVIQMTQDLPERTLRIDADVVAWFKSTGPGYQTRINNVLRTFMQHRTKARGPA
ncbi:MAG: BrnA antitoxin family protein [Pseudomonadota bacterium]|nr:BrnA antitoxin family protein [Pseudomonadota bacterium]